MSKIKTYLIPIFIFINSIFLCAQKNTAFINSSKNDTIVKNIGINLSLSFKKNNINLFKKYFETDNFIKKNIIQEKNNKTLTKFNNKHKNELIKKINSFPKEICNDIDHGDFYNFVSYHFDPINKSYHLIFRYYSQVYGIDYHDYKLIKKNNQIIIDDIYIFSLSQKISEVLKLYYLGELPKNILAKNKKSEDFKYTLMLKNFIDSKNNNELEKAYKHITLLNNSFNKKSRLTAVLKLKTSENLNEEAYFESMEDIIENFNKDPSINLNALNYHVQNMDFDNAYKCIINIENYTNDTFLDFEKANLYYKSGDFDSAKFYYENMVKNYPFFHLPKFSLLTIYEKTNETDEAVKLLNIILKTSNFEKTEIIKKVKEQLPLISNSSEFNNWCKN